MRRILFSSLLVPAALFAQAPKATPPKYTSHPASWKLELRQVPGGWTTQGRIEAEFKLVDPTDPDPPKPGSSVDYDPDVEEQPERQKENKWPDRPTVKLLYWFNGERRELQTTVGYATTVELEGQNGENRLEVRVPGSGQHATRTWYAITTRDRLLIRLSEVDEGEGHGWWGGGLQVVEPDHTESIGYEPTPSGGKNRGDSYIHASPLPGTYTVRWFDGSQGVEGYEWGGGYYGGNRKPKKVRVEVVLDPGTEQERRWSFERLIIPGTRRVTLGSFDVEG